MPIKNIQYRFFIVLFMSCFSLSAAQQTDQIDQSWQMISALASCSVPECVSDQFTLKTPQQGQVSIIFKKPIDPYASLSEKLQSLSFSFFSKDQRLTYETALTNGLTLTGPDIYTHNGYVSHMLPLAITAVRHYRNSPIDEIEKHFKVEENNVFYYAAHLFTLGEIRKTKLFLEREKEDLQHQIHPFRVAGTTIEPQGKKLLEKILEKNGAIHSLKQQILFIKKNITTLELSPEHRPNPFSAGLLLELISTRVAQQEGRVTPHSPLTNTLEELNLLP